jgi:hypothetical protein
LKFVLLTNSDECVWSFCAYFLGIPSSISRIAIYTMILFRIISLSREREREQRPVAN